MNVGECYLDNDFHLSVKVGDDRCFSFNTGLVFDCKGVQGVYDMVELDHKNSLIIYKYQYEDKDSD